MNKWRIKRNLIVSIILISSLMVSLIHLPNSQLGSTIVSAQNVQRPKADEVSTGHIIIGTFLIHMKSLDKSNLGVAKTTLEKLDGMFYKSEFANGTWFDLGNSADIKDIMSATSKTKVASDEIDKRKIEVWIDEAGNIYNLYEKDELNKDIDKLKKQIADELKSHNDRVEDRAESAEEAKNMNASQIDEAIQLKMTLKDLDAQIAFLEALRNNNTKAAKIAMAKVNNPQAIIQEIAEEGTPPAVSLDEKPSLEEALKEAFDEKKENFLQAANNIRIDEALTILEELKNLLDVANLPTEKETLENIAEEIKAKNEISQAAINEIKKLKANPQLSTELKNLLKQIETEKQNLMKAINEINLKQAVAAISEIIKTLEAIVAGSSDKISPKLPEQIDELKKQVVKADEALLSADIAEVNKALVAASNVLNNLQIFAGIEDKKSNVPGEVPSDSLSLAEIDAKLNQLIDQFKTSKDKNIMLEVLKIVELKALAELDILSEIKDVQEAIEIVSKTLESAQQNETQEIVNGLKDTLANLNSELTKLEKQKLFAERDLLIDIKAELADKLIEDAIIKKIKEIQQQELSQYTKEELNDIEKIKNQMKNGKIVPLPVENVIASGVELKFEVPPVIIDNRAYIHVRPVSESFGALVTWDPSSQTVTIVKDSIFIVCQIGNKIVFVNGKPVILDVAPQLVSQRTIVPLRFISEYLGLDVTWWNELRVIEIGGFNVYK